MPVPARAPDSEFPTDVIRDRDAPEFKALSPAGCCDIRQAIAGKPDSPDPDEREICPLWMAMKSQGIRAAFMLDRVNVKRMKGKPLLH